MCGIISYYGDKSPAKIVKDGLETLEYRGYDSCGVVINTQNGLVVKKDIGRVKEVLKELPQDQSKMAMGHTRWATHGGVSKENSHPHLSNNEKIAVIHNGIIENYQELRLFLKQEGFKFSSETDTEIIPNLIQFYLTKENNLNAAVKRTVHQLEGSFAIIVMSSDHHKMIVVRKESPLVIGVGDNEFFVASDIPAFLQYTKKVMYLHDWDFVEIGKGYLKTTNLKSNEEVNRQVDTIAWDVEQAKKGKFEHFLLKEITEQADVVTKAMQQNPEIIKEIAESIKNAKGIYFIGCGTAYHACLAASYKFSSIAKLHVNVCLASEFPNYQHFIVPETLVIAVSQSGETADLLEAIKVAKIKGAKVLSIVNVMGSSLMRESDHSLLQQAGPEIAVLSTKSYTSQVSILTLLAHALAGSYDEGKEKLNDLIKHIYYLTSLSTRDHVKKVAEKLQYAKDLYIIGRGDQFATALEAALKIKEASYIHAEGFAGGELKHGSIALIEKGVPCIVLTSESTEKQILSNAMELKSRGGYIIGIGPNNNEIFDFFIKVREAEEFNSICQIVPLQILAYQLAVLRGCDPDKPRNLAKSVTVK
ncbi:glutamine--fructose-6-phosphate transaminase (isomerizing) [Candidatus Woesearchaeota archaeon]|mgnify:CR=1 FL=1|jgi:glutamine---fructose-6-phosphate transaminase (isomerizing)|nr:glutamine--fructose-6-phosphate transaminase (isomerizing) [Candidatus Woesearchaeota archaeon]MBT5740554.1 glutamine--fructose-6-phosphate transaminase (isomerizing) [Candidatus Woesearchaeota archaeon]